MFDHYARTLPIKRALVRCLVFFFAKKSVRARCVRARCVRARLKGGGGVPENPVPPLPPPIETASGCSPVRFRPLGPGSAGSSRRDYLRPPSCLVPDLGATSSDPEVPSGIVSGLPEPGRLVAIEPETLAANELGSEGGRQRGTDMEPGSQAAIKLGVQRARHR